MKRIVYILMVLLYACCDSDKGWDCIRTAGSIVQQEVSTSDFDKIVVWGGVKLFVEQGAEQRVVIETGSNLMADINITATDGRLSIHNNNTCNLVRDYGITKVFVTSPNLTEIRSSTGMGIESVGLLSFPSLSLLSEDHAFEGQTHVDGDFTMDLEVEDLMVVANGVSKFYLKGSVNNASFGLYSGDCRIYSEDLVVQNLDVYHRSSGPMVVNPIESIKGEIVGIGNIISKNRPSIVEVEERYRGRLIFE
ncbi:MAG TPA: head GIN domain-containing protein [Aequorivita sp.]|nr:head GIN domain-containing protein [Aequorivita sp.]